MAVAGVTPLLRAVLVGTVAIWLAAEVRQGLRRRPEAKKVDRGSRMVIRLTNVSGVIGAIAVSHAVPGADVASTGLLTAIGLVLLWCGVGLRLWSFQTLGRYFTFTVQTSGDQPVISSGPYRVIRHPGYAGILLAVIGLGLNIGNWLALVVLVAALATGLVFRIQVEERALSRDLAASYQAYAATHKRLVPFVW